MAKHCGIKKSQLHISSPESSSHMSPSTFKILPLLALVPLSGAFAQVPEIRANSFELGGFIGASYGIDQARVMGGGNVSYAVNKWLLPYVEYSYFPGFQRT